MIAPLGVVLGGESGITINPDRSGRLPGRAGPLAHLADRRIDDVAFLTGDIHIYMANHMVRQAPGRDRVHRRGAVTSSGLPKELNGVAVPVIQLASARTSASIEGAEHGLGDRAGRRRRACGSSTASRTSAATARAVADVGVVACSAARARTSFEQAAGAA